MKTKTISLLNNHAIIQAGIFTEAMINFLTKQLSHFQTDNGGIGKTF